MQLSFDAVRMGFEAQSQMIGFFKGGPSLMQGPAPTIVAPDPVKSALAGTPYAASVLRVVADEAGVDFRRYPEPPPRAKRPVKGSAKKAVRPAKKSAKAPARRKKIA
jgi:hypothetical protein